MSLIVAAVIMVAVYAFMVKSANTRGLPTRQQAVAAAAGYRNRSRAAAQQRSTSVLREIETALVPSNRTDRHIIALAFVSVIVLAFSVGGALHGSVMVGIVALCLAPALALKVRSTLMLRRLMRRAHLSQDEPLYVPDEWQSH
jgi:Flp pilus assembly protein TadB